ncbi:MAG TPA: carboxypeptidase-like regulatory domain-containing protein [Rubricoccaceae bacterium]|jgi:hypothetical protein
MRLVLLLALLAPLASSAQGTGAIEGHVVEVDGAMAVISANVRIADTTWGAATDIDGHYRIDSVPVGTYVLVVSYAGAPTVYARKVRVGDGQVTRVSLTMAVPEATEVLVCGYESPMFTNDAIGHSRTLAGWDLENMPVNR